MNMQNVKDLSITEGDVRTIHDSSGNLLWGRLAYDTKYAGDTVQDGTPSPDTPVPVQVVTGEQTVNVYGKNLFNSYIATKPSWQSGTLVVNPDGTFTVSGNTSSNNYFQLGQTLGTLCPDLNVGDTVYLFLDTTCIDKRIYIGGNWVGGYSKTITQAMLNAVVVIYGGYNQTDTIKIMVTKAPENTYEHYQSHNYTVSLGSLELAKIGDYEDYIYNSGDDWYVHKATNSIVLNGSSEGYWYRNNSVTGADIYGFQLNPPFPNVALKNTGVLGYLSDLFISLAASQWNANIEGLVQMNDKAFQIHILRSRLADGTRDTFIAWLSTHNTKLYYALATPTDTKITDATLIGQLNAIHEWLTRYGYNSTVSGNLPLLIEQTNIS